MIPKYGTLEADRAIDETIDWEIDFWIEEKHLQDEPEQQELFEEEI